jgi:hypothetical protein
VRKVCTQCCREKDGRLFYPVRTGSTKLRSKCAECHCDNSRVAYHGDIEAQRDRVYFNLLRRVYGMQPEQYWAMLDAQGRACAVCRCSRPDDGGRPRWLEVDYDDEHKRVRGLVCDGCQHLLTARGLGPEDMSFLQWAGAAESYVRESKP